MACLLAFVPLLWATQATASKAVLLEEANARLSTAKSNYSVSLDKYNQAKAANDAAISILTQAQGRLTSANKAYNESSIPDPSWTRPLVEEKYFESVSYSIQVPYTVQETTTSQVARTVQVPHTTTVSETIQVPREVTTLTEPGLSASVYNMQGYNSSPPLPTDDRLMFTTSVASINFNWGGNRVMDSGPYEDVIVKFTGNIYIPESGTYGFYAPGDDGVQVIIDNTQIINDWYDKGGGGSTVTVDLSAGLHSITVWYYENGGGANVWLYWAKPNMAWEIVPASAFGQQTQTEIVYDTVQIEREVVTYTEETVYDDVEVLVDVVYYREETRYRDKERTRLVPDESAEHPRIKDPSLLPEISSAEASVSESLSQQSSSQQSFDAASSELSSASSELSAAEAYLNEVLSLPEPQPTPEPTLTPEPEATLEPKPETSGTPKPLPSTEPPVSSLPEEPEEIVSELLNVKPEELTDAQVDQLVEAALETFETAEPVSQEYQQALEALAVAAEADDLELPEELAAIPLIGDVAGAALEAFNVVGNIGADMAPQTREQAEKTIIASVIAAQAAIGAVQAATSAASAAASTAASGGTRRN